MRVGASDVRMARDHAGLLPCFDRVFGAIYLPKRYLARFGIDEPMA